ncbi:MAG TPA: hypothetical protein VEL77_15135 [Rugosimonospora sp.]|nr:hypothetical protein [Rugosimonospora sp.]
MSVKSPESPEPDVVAVEVVCCDCRKRRKTKLTPAGNPRTPMGWHKHDKDAESVVYCPDCWAKRYLLRAVAMPIASPYGCTWEELRNDLKLMWRETTRASNWLMTELYTRDCRRAGEEKMPPMQPIDFYTELKRFPALPPQTRVSLAQSCTKKYKALRRDVIWTCAKSLPSFRYPVPFPVHNQSWSVRIEKGRAILRVRIGEGWRELRLKSGPQFRRQYRSVQLIARGEAITGEAAIYQRQFEGKSALMVKMVAWLPRTPVTGLKPDSVLPVYTRKDALLQAVNTEDEVLWTYNADHLRRWSEEHRKTLQRLADDNKFEARPVPSFTDRRTALVRKYRDRMDSATHEIAAQLASYAARRKFAVMRYDDTERGFCESLPWYRLKLLIEQKCEALGIRFEAAGPKESETKESEARENQQ